MVASEVRALARRSAEAAKEINGLVSSSTAQVDLGVDLVAQTGQALERIVAQVVEINKVVSNIAASAQGQTTALRRVDAAASQMDQATRPNAAMAEETRAAARSLVEETEELSRLIGRFQIGPIAETSVREAPKRPPARLSRANRRSERNPAPRPAPTRDKSARGSCFRLRRATGGRRGLKGATRARRQPRRFRCARLHPDCQRKNSVLVFFRVRL